MRFISIMYLDEDSSSDVEDCGYGRIVLGPSHCASRTTCAHVLALPDVFTDMKEHYTPFGFFDTATVDGMINALRPHISVKVIIKVDKFEKDVLPRLEKE